MRPETQEEKNRFYVIFHSMVQVTEKTNCLKQIQSPFLTSDQRLCKALYILVVYKSSEDQLILSRVPIIQQPKFCHVFLF